MSTMNETQLYFAAVRSDLKTFLHHAFNDLNRNTEFLDNWHIDAIVYHLEEAIEGRMPRLIINLPPRQLKSFVVSVVFPAFLLGLDPSARLLCVSYSDELGKALARDFRRIVESEWYQRIFPHSRPRINKEGEFVTDQGGGRFAISVGGSLTGRGGDFIIVDDPIKPDDAYSDKLRQSNNDWFRTTLLSRLDDKSRGVLILVMQRLHINDLTGFLEESGEFKKLSLPAIASKTERIQTGKDAFFERHEGDVLHPERENRDVLEKLRNQMGSAIFLAQYQQRPEMPDGQIFRRSWFKIIDQPPRIDSSGKWIISIDTAMSTAETADYTAISIVYQNADGYCVMAADRGRWSYEDLQAKAKRYMRQFGEELHFVIEYANIGISLYQWLLTVKNRWVFHYQPQGNKVSRACRVVPIIESGRVFIVNQPGNNHWVEPYLSEFMVFPFGRFDDQVDSLCQVLLWAENRFNSGGKFTLC